MTIQALRKHLKWDCAANRSCKDCNQVYPTMSDFYDHLRFICPYVQITCCECNQTMSRKQFRQHQCYLDLKPKDAPTTECLQCDIPQLRDEYMRLMKENEDLQRENEQLKAHFMIKQNYIEEKETDMVLMKD